MLMKADLILGTDKINNLKKVLTIYGEITGNKKLYNETVAIKIKQHIGLLQGDQLFAPHLAEIWTSLQPKHQ
jgi:hypothetical protein